MSILRNILITILTKMSYALTNQKFFQILSSQDSIITFLKERDIYNTSLSCRKCSNTKMRLGLKKQRNAKMIALICTNRKCKYWYSADIFKLNDSTNMKIEEILQIIWYWSQSQPAK